MNGNVFSKREISKKNVYLGILLTIFFSVHFLFAQMPIVSARKGNVFSIRDFGAVNDGKTMNTIAFKDAINACASEGGGTVFVPAGEYLTGPIHFKSNITLYIDAGATLKFSTNFDDYFPLVKSRFQGVEVMRPSGLIYGYQVENIAIVGRGKIDGQGKAWWDYFIPRWRKFQETGQEDDNKWSRAIKEANKDIELEHLGFLRPSLTNFYECRNIHIEGVSIENSPFWTNHFVKCEDVLFTGVSVHNPISYNTDGITIESCKNVRISDCFFDTDDDCISIKAGKGKEQRENGVTCENITITNCVLTNGAAGICIGSEMSGSVRDITVSNCVIDGTKEGLFIKSVRGRGGKVENFTANNIVINNMTNGPAIRISKMYWFKTDPEPISERTPTFRNFYFTNISGRNNNKAIELLGLEEKDIENITLSNIDLTAIEGLTAKYVNNIKLNNVQITAKKNIPFIFEEVSDLNIDKCRTLVPHISEPAIVLNNTSDVFIHSCFPVNETKTFVYIKGKKTKNIYMAGNNFENIQKPVIIESKIKAEVKMEPEMSAQVKID